MSEKIWSDEAWDDYLYWQTQDKKTIRRINELIKDIDRSGPMKGIGKPEPLKKTCKDISAAASMIQTVSFTKWKMAEYISLNAVPTTSLINIKPIDASIQKLASNFHCGNSKIDWFLRNSTALDIWFGKTSVSDLDRAKRRAEREG